MLTIECTDMGYSCGEKISGSNLDELVEACKIHARDIHNMSEDEINSPELHERWRAAVRQVSRPPALRTPRTVE